MTIKNANVTTVPSEFRWHKPQKRSTSIAQNKQQMKKTEYALMSLYSLI